MDSAPAVSRGKLLAAFLAVYLIWGSTYLAIRFAIDTLPPFMMGGVRFVTAGGLIYAWMRLRGATRPTRAEWKVAAVVGTLLLLVQHGAVVWAMQTVPSGIAALLIAITPCWMVIVDWLRPGGTRPSAQVWVGLLLGVAGIALLIGPSDLTDSGTLDIVASVVIVVSTLGWAIGSIYSRYAPAPSTPLLSTGMQMLVGGGLLLAASVIAGEPSRVALDQVSMKSVGALLYLIVFGAIVAYSAYVWLLRASTPALVGTHAYVNPIVAVFLGWAFASEPLTARMLVATAVIIAGVALITVERRPRAARARDLPVEAVPEAQAVT